jgi:hypothetical protein
VSEIWFRKFYDPNDFKKKEPKLLELLKKNGSRIKLLRKHERSDVIRCCIRVGSKTEMTTYQ